MTRKVMDISEGGRRFVCVYDDTKTKPYRLYEITCNRGLHRRQVAKFYDFYSVLWELTDMGREVWQ